MVTYYKFTRSTRRFSMMFIMNAVLLAIMCWAALRYIWVGEEHEESRQIILWAVVAAEFVVLAIALYLFVRNKEVQLWVTPSEFHYYDPIWGDFGFTVPVSDIVALRQVRFATNQNGRHFIELVNGDTKQIMYQNYSINRRKLFAALKKANPQIDVPEGPWKYELLRPEWAKKIREKLGLDD